MGERASDRLTQTQASYLQLLQRFPGGYKPREDGGIPSFICSDLSHVMLRLPNELDTVLSALLDDKIYTLNEIGLEEKMITIAGNILNQQNQIGIVIKIDTASVILTAEHLDRDDDVIILPVSVGIFQEAVAIAKQLPVDSFVTEVNY